MKTIFISGANRGIGLELARQCLNAGDRVLAACRNPAEANDLKDLRGVGGELEILELTVDDEDSVDSCFRRLRDQGQGFDLLFNNAGIIDWSDLATVEKDSLERIYRTNLVGALLVMRAALPCLGRSSDPLVVNLSSRLGSISLRGGTQLGGAVAYQCSKAALNMLTRQAAIDWAPMGVRVISISPGWVKTDMGGPDAKYEVEESVRLILQTLAELDPKASGVFVGEDGEEISW